MNLTQHLVLAVAVLTVGAAAPAADFAGLMPGASTLADAERALGEAAPRGSTYVFSGDKYAAREIVVALAEDHRVIRTISIIAVEPQSLSDTTSWMGLGAPDATDPQGQDVVYSYRAPGVQLRVRGDRVIELVHLAPGAAAQPPGRLPAKTIGERPPQPPPPPAINPGSAAAPPPRALDLRPPGWLGVRVGGRYVTTVFEGGPAATSDVREGDEILEIDGRLTVTAHLLREALGDIRPDQQVALRAARDGTSVDAVIRAVDADAYFARQPKGREDLGGALALAEQGRLSQAEAAFRTLAAQGNLRAQYELAQVAERIDLKRGQAEWRAFLARPDDQKPRHWLIHAREESKLCDEALGGLMRMTEAMDQGAYDDGMLAFTLSNSVPVASSSYYFSRGYCFKNQRRFTEAALAFFTASRLWSGDSTSWYHLSECLEPYDLANSRYACEQYLRMSEGNTKQEKLRPNVTARLARVAAALERSADGDRHAAAGRGQEALGEYEKAAQSAPASAQVAMCRARALVLLGRAKDALDICGRVEDFGTTPAAASVAAYAGDLHFKVGRYAQASDAYSTACELSGNVPLYVYQRALADEKIRPAPIAALSWKGYLVQSEDHPGEAERRQDAMRRLAAIQP